VWPLRFLFSQVSIYFVWFTRNLLALRETHEYRFWLTVGSVVTSYFLRAVHEHPDVFLPGSS
jgi:hypothetical protein